jgi:hypothetical protein
MSVSTTVRKVGFNGNNIAVAFPFAFKVFQQTDVLVVLTDSLGNQTTQALTSQYSVSLNAEQDTSPGGTVTMVTAPPTGYTLTIGSQLAALQSTVLTNTGGFFPTVLNNALDYLTILVQQIISQLSGVISFPFSDPSGLNATLPTAAQRANTLMAFDASGNVVQGPNIAAVGTVTSNIANINAVAADLANINTDAGDVSAINAVASDLTNINAVAGDLTNINSVAGDKVNIDAVAGDLTNINNVAGDLTNINIVAADKVNIDAVAGDLTNINAAAGALAAINAAPTQATNAANSATAAANSASAAATAAAGVNFTLASTSTFQNKTLQASGGNVVEATSGPSNTPFSFRNRIINGAMNVNQRVGYAGTPTPGLLSYSLDRWGVGVGSGSTAVTISQASTGGLAGFPNCAKVQRNSGQTNTSSIYFVQQIESVNMADLQGKTISLSFFSKAGANYSAASNNLTVYATFGTGTDQGSWGALGGWTGFTLTTPISTALTTSFQKFTGTTTVPANANEMAILFVFTPTGTAGADDSFSVTGVQIESGSVATPFENRPFGTELALCQRYFETLNGVTSLPFLAVVYSASQVPVGAWIFKVTKRASPTVIGSSSSRIVFPTNIGGSGGAIIASTVDINWTQLGAATPVSTASAGWIDSFTATASSEL